MVNVGHNDVYRVLGTRFDVFIMSLLWNKPRIRGKRVTKPFQSVFEDLFIVLDQANIFHLIYVQR